MVAHLCNLLECIPLQPFMNDVHVDGVGHHLESPFLDDFLNVEFELFYSFGPLDVESSEVLFHGLLDLLMNGIFHFESFTSKQNTSN
jgi:hypothetical protein